WSGGGAHLPPPTGWRGGGGPAGARSASVSGPGPLDDDRGRRALGPGGARRMTFVLAHSRWPALSYGVATRSPPRPTLFELNESRQAQRGGSQIRAEGAM